MDGVHPHHHPLIYLKHDDMMIKLPRMLFSVISVLHTLKETDVKNMSKFITMLTTKLYKIIDLCFHH